MYFSRARSAAMGETQAKEWSLRRRKDHTAACRKMKNAQPAVRISITTIRRTVDVLRCRVFVGTGGNSSWGSAGLQGIENAVLGSLEALPNCDSGDNQDQQHRSRSQDADPRRNSFHADLKRL